MARSEWFVKLLKLGFPRKIRRQRIMDVPFVQNFVKRKFFEGDNLVCLPRDRVIEVGESVKKPDNVVLPSQVVHHFIDEANYHWIMNFCICRDASLCKDYPLNLGCLFMGEAVLGINPKFGRLVSKAEAHDHIKRAGELGLVHMIGKNKLDTWWLGVQPGERLLTVCNCCPCCCISRGLAYAPKKIGETLVRMPGITVSITDDCIGCGTCAQEGVCFTKSISMVAGRAVISDNCRGCGRCVDVCPQSAIEIKVETDEYVNDTIERIQKSVYIK